MRISAETAGGTADVTVRREDDRYVVEIDGVRHDVDVRKLEGDFCSILMENRSYEVSVQALGDAYHVRHGAAERIVRLTDPGRRARETLQAAGGPTRVTAVMPGRVVRVLVDPGQQVVVGQGLVVVEAMKMENEIAAPRGGRVDRVEVEPGQTVDSGALLAVLESEG